MGVHLVDVLAQSESGVPGRSEYVAVQDLRATAAGTAAATSVDLAKLGVKVEAFGAVGSDALGRLLRSLLADADVGTSLIVEKTRLSTSTSLVIVWPDGDRSVLYAPGADRRLDESDLSDAHWRAIDTARVLHVGGPDALGRFAGAPLVRLIERARAHGAIVTADLLQPGAPVTLQRLAPVFTLADWLLINEQQLRGITGQDAFDEAVASLRSITRANLAVTKGGHGCTIITGEESFTLPALPVAVVDVTGCGDAFNAGFILGLLLDRSALDCGWLATACGALTATGLGSDAGLIDFDQVVHFLWPYHPLPSDLQDRAQQLLRPKTRHDVRSPGGCGSPCAGESHSAPQRSAS